MGAHGSPLVPAPAQACPANSNTSTDGGVTLGTQGRLAEGTRACPEASWTTE